MEEEKKKDESPIPSQKNPLIIVTAPEMRESSVERHTTIHDLPYRISVYGDTYLTP